MGPDVAHHIRDLSLILGTAAATGLISLRLRQPPVLGYLLAGVLLGPHVPGIVMDGDADAGVAQGLSEFGVILLTFSIGLEFSLRKIARVGPAAGLTAVFEVGLVLALGFLAARLCGFDDLPSLFVGACVCSSSTMIAAKAFEELKLRGGHVDLTFAVLVCDDMLTILLFAVLTAIASGAGLSPLEFAASVGKLSGFLVALLVFGLLLVPRALRRIVALGRPELTLIASVAVCFTMATLAASAGYSVALGAFIAGMLAAESGEGPAIEPMVLPLRNLFAAVFFIAVGMQIDPLQVVAQWHLVLIFTAVVLVGKVLGVSLGAFLTGNGVQTSLRAGMSCAHNGEFSFIIAAFAISAGVLDPSIFPVVVGVSVLTQLTTPWMVRRSERAAARFAGDLPPKLQTFAAFYAAWIEQLRAAPRSSSLSGRVRREVVMIAVDASLLLAALAGSDLIHWDVVTTLSYRFTLPPWLVDTAWIGATLLVGGVFFVGVLRRTAALSRLLAEVVVPAGAHGELDLGSAPRRAFTVGLELALGLVIGLPLVAISQPFVPLSSGLVTMAVVVAVLIYNAWRSVTNLQGHVRAGTDLVVEMLARQSRDSAALAHEEHARLLSQGYPGMTALRLVEGSAAVGHTLAGINLRMRSGATVVAVNREPSGARPVAPRETLHVGDVLSVAGPRDAVEAATRILTVGPAVDPSFLRYAAREE